MTVDDEHPYTITPAGLPERWIKHFRMRGPDDTPPGAYEALKARYPGIPIVWGGNFGSLYPAPVLNAPYVDWLVRGQGEATFVELIEAHRK